MLRRRREAKTSTSSAAPLWREPSRLAKADPDKAEISTVIRVMGCRGRINGAATLNAMLSLGVEVGVGAAGGSGKMEERS